MRLTVNGSELDLPSGADVPALITHLDLGARRLAVEINGEILPRSAYAQAVLRDGDRVEIVQAIGGG
jgi:sulfur carrier protein